MTEVDEKESLARAHLPYRAEYCKTSRARCKKCDRCMEEDSLKLANMVKSRFHDGHDAHFYHVDCFFRVKRPSSVAEIRHFETLRYEDQKMLEEAVETRGQSILGIGDEENTNKRGRRSVGKCMDKDFLVEYAKSSRSKCVLCDQKIEKQSVRLGKMDYDVETPWGSGPVPRWFHIECFIKSMSQLEFYGDISEITNFDELEDDDQKMLKNKIKPLKRVPEKNGGDPSGGKKARVEEGIKINLEDSEEERLLMLQSDRFFALRSIVATMKRKDIELMMDHMRQKYNYKNVSILIDMATDVLLFGPIEKCPECKQAGGMQLRGSCYICTKSTEWAPCTYETREPRRSVPDIPEELLEKYEFFNDGYKFHGGKRIFSTKFLKAVEEKEAENNNTVVEGAPLEGLTLGITSWKALDGKKADVQKKVNALGGKIVTALDRSLFVILSNEDELAMETPKIEVAKDLNVPFATDHFIFKIKTKDDVVEQLARCIIGEWDGDLSERYTRMNVNQLKQNLKSRAKSSTAKSLYKSSRAPKSHTLVVKDGTAVDPESNLAEVGRVYRKGANIYSVVLNSIDVTRDKNSYYKMQVIEHETRKEYYLYRAWGRIGCEVGGTSCRELEDAEVATETFEKLFEEKTGNSFSSLATGNFRRVHGLYFPIEVDYSDPHSRENGVKLEYNSESNLVKPVQELICFIFDIQRMHKAMKRFELDAEKMPLGKLSEKHILEAMETLKELQQVLEVKPPKKPAKKQLVALTNKFYSLIPQSFGDGQVQLISSLGQVDNKNQMLAELQEIEVAYRMCTTIEQNPEKIAVDQYYMKLDCTIGALDHEDNRFRLISDYVSKTHAITHNNYKLVVAEIFQVHREADMKRFVTHKNKNRCLLWHGSRVTNFAGILSQGLRVAPPEAPSTGFMFGKGIYFADMSSKAANYCMADPTNSTGLLLLCEVALGKTHDLLESDPNLPKGLPKDCDSVRGVGKSTTDPKTHVNFEDDICVPIGKQVPNKGVKSQLLYNEYVVYDESQAMLRYIVQVEFGFKR